MGGGLGGCGLSFRRGNLKAFDGESLRRVIFQEDSFHPHSLGNSQWTIQEVFYKRRFYQSSHLVKDLRQGSSSFFTFFLRSSVTVGPPMALLLRMGMKMLVTIRSMFHNRFSGSRASMNPAYDGYQSCFNKRTTYHCIISSYHCEMNIWCKTE